MGVTDLLPFGVGVRMEEAPSEAKGGLLGGLFGGKKDKKDDKDDDNKWHKRNTLFSPNSR